MMDTGEIKGLIYDNVSGAREIAERSLALLQRAATTSPATDPATLLDDLAGLATKVIRSKPEMAQVFQVINRFLLDAEALERGAADAGSLRMGVVSLAQDHLRALASSLDHVAGHAQSLLPNGAVVLTHSRSSTVLAALRRAKHEGKLFDVIAPESRPNLEGRTLARELSEDQVPVRVVVDALVGTAVEGCDRVLVGADALTPHAVVNKVGTRLVALAARRAGVPVTVLAESSKAWVRRADPMLGLLTGRSREPKEVWDAPPYGVEVVNLYFEATPLELVSEIVDESAAHPAAGYWEAVQRRGYSRRLGEAFEGELV